MVKKKPKKAANLATMWHEARKQEKKIRGLMVDYKKRAERRREFYEKIKLDPTQFLRLQGRPLKIHLDHAVAMAAESPQSMMPWRGQPGNMIDRFDVRANLDIIPEPRNEDSPIEFSKSQELEERMCSYESYRTLVENESAGLSEEQCLYQIYVDEQFGPLTKVGSTEDEKQKLSEKKAAIGFTYEDSTPAADKEDSEDEESSDTDVETADLDVTLDVSTLTVEQMVLLNECAHQFGMKEEDYISLLTKDKDEMESLRQAKILEEEKAQFSGRKSRRERRAFKEKQMAGRKISPPSYAARESPKYTPYKKSSSSSRSRSRSPEAPTKVMFITSFGGDSEEEPGPVHGPALPEPPLVKTSRSHTRKNSNEKSHGEKRSNRRTESRSRSPRRTNSRSRSPRGMKSRSKSPRKRKSRSRSPYRKRRFGSRSSSGSPRGRRYSNHRRSRSRSPIRSPEKGSRKNYGYNSGGRAQEKSSTRSRSREGRVSRENRRSTSRSSPMSRSSSRSRSSSYSRSSRSSDSRSRSRDRSKSRSPNGKSKPQIKRYRRPSLSSAEDSESDTKESNFKPKRFVSSAPSSKSVAALQVKGNSLTPQDKLKKRMQAALNRQYKADKKAEQIRTVKMEQERIDREEDMRSRMLEIRRKERERRHLEREHDRGRRRNSDSSSSSSSSSEDDDDDQKHDNNDRKRGRSRSKSPKQKKTKSRSRSRGPSEKAKEKDPQDEKSHRDEKGPRDERVSRDERGPRDDRGPHDDRGPRNEKVSRDERGLHEDRGPRGERGPRDVRGPRDMRGPYEERGPRVYRGPRDERGPWEERGRSKYIHPSNY